MATYFTMVTESCISSITGISYGAYVFANFALLFVTPYIIDNQNNQALYSLFMGINILLCTLFGWYYIVETQGLEKSEIYEVLRGNKTRSQILNQRNLSVQNGEQIDISN